MNEEKIKVVYFDGEPIVYRDYNQLNEKEIVDLLVEYFEDCDILIKENEELRKGLKYLKHKYDSLHDVCSKLEKKVKCVQEEANDYCEELMGKDAFIQLYKRQRNEVIEENEILKQQVNYIQNSISEHIKHQKTELGQKALQEIIEDYNKWLLGHKRSEE